MAVKARGQVTLAVAVDVASVTRYYLLQSSTLTKPAKPTTETPSSSWTTTEPTYTEGSTSSLYSCDETKFSDNTFMWSDVSLSSSYEASKTAYNKAKSASDIATAIKSFFFHDTAGAHVATTADSPDTGFNALWTATRLAFRNAATELMTISADLIELGNNSKSAVIKFCGGSASLSCTTEDTGDYVMLKSATAVAGIEYEASGAETASVITGWYDSASHGNLARMDAMHTYGGEQKYAKVQTVADDNGGHVQFSGDYIEANATSGSMTSFASLLGLHIFTGSTIVTINSNGNAVLMSANAYQTQVGRAYAQAKDMVFVMNGDSNVGDTTITAGYWPSDGNIWIHCGQIASRQVRVNWMFVFAGV